MAYITRIEVEELMSSILLRRSGRLVLLLLIKLKLKLTKITYDTYIGAYTSLFA